MRAHLHRRQPAGVADNVIRSGVDVRAPAVRKPHVMACPVHPARVAKGVAGDGRRIYPRLTAHTGDR
jgi:hypothetical protein